MQDEIERLGPLINRGGREHNCFGCGTLNSTGLQLEFRRKADSVWADFRPDKRFEGYLGMVHGGILTAMLDEAMSWAITADGEFAVTARLNASFRNPALVHSQLRVEGKVKLRRKRLLDTVATITDLDTGLVVATAEGRFMRVSEQQAATWREAYLDASID